MFGCSVAVLGDGFGKRPVAGTPPLQVEGGRPRPPRVFSWDGKISTASGRVRVWEIVHQRRPACLRRLGTAVALLAKPALCLSSPNLAENRGAAR